MDIKKNKIENNLTIAVSGRIDTTTAPELSDVIQSSLKDIKELIFDFENLEYISSAGLRVLLMAQKIMNKQGSMIIKNANELVRDIFRITGFEEILTIK